MSHTDPPEAPRSSGFGHETQESLGAGRYGISASMRRQMPICQRFAYFDHAAVAPLPAPTAAAISRFAQQASELGDTPWLEWSATTHRLRSMLAEMVHADIDEIALVANTSTGIGMVAEGWRWRTGDSIVVPANEFPSNLAPWRQLKRRGVEVREVEVPADGQLTVDRLLAAIDSTTRIVAVSWVGFVSGYRIDVAEFCEAIHERGALVFLDAIQGLGAFPLDVRSAGVDFCAADGHKWMLGPEGAGMLFVAREHLEKLDPLMIGWHSLDERAAFDPKTTTLKATAARFEGGSANMVGLIGWEQSIRLLLEHQAHIEGSGWAEAILSNVAYLQKRLEYTGCTVHVPEHAQHRSGILTITWPEAAPEFSPMNARKVLLDAGIVTSVRAGRLRASTHAYNNTDDIDRFIHALTQFRRPSNA